jgi:TRAP-type transport system small permease protein
MKGQGGFSKLLDVVSRGPGVVALLTISVLVVAGVISRFILNHPLHFVEEFSGYLQAMLIFFPLGYVTKHADHIRLDILVDHLPARAKRSLQVMNLFIALGISFFLAAGMLDLAVKSFITGRRAYSFTGTLVWPVLAMLFLGLILFFVQIVLKIIATVKGSGAAAGKME